MVYIFTNSLSRAARFTESANPAAPRVIATRTGENPNFSELRWHIAEKIRLKG